MRLSVIVPTYTGTNHIYDCLSSIARQTKLPAEAVVVIDGPEKWRLEHVQSAANKLKGMALKIIIHQNRKNLGRFKARLKGAELATGSQLLFVDDRVELAPNYIEVIEKLKEDIVLPSVTERDTGNPIGRVNNLFRNKIFGKYASTSYPILSENFDQLPKGTSGLWLPKKWFIDACKTLGRQTDIDATMSDDTKLLKSLVDTHGRIFRENRAVIYYNPREGFIESINHLYHRGPKFVDYYFKPSRRYFMLLLLFYVLIVPVIALFIISPILLVWLAGLLLVISFWLDPNVISWPYTTLGVILVLASFGFGLINGLIKLAGKNL